MKPETNTPLTQENVMMMAKYCQNLRKILNFGIVEYVDEFGEHYKPIPLIQKKAMQLELYNLLDQFKYFFNIDTQTNYISLFNRRVNRLPKD